MAHRKKRDLIGWKTDADKQEYMTAAMLCRKHHTEFEHAGHEPMFEEITRIIEQRSA